MSSVVVDANVWVSAVDPSDPLQAESRKFLSFLSKRPVKIILPTFARLEVACALSRRFNDPIVGRKLSESLFKSPMVQDELTDSKIIMRAILVGTENGLRAADAIYATVSLACRTPLVTWDSELISRAQALTPRAWLEAHS